MSNCCEKTFIYEPDACFCNRCGKRLGKKEIIQYVSISELMIKGETRLLHPIATSVKCRGASFKLCDSFRDCLEKCVPVIKYLDKEKKPLDLEFGTDKYETDMVFTLWFCASIKKWGPLTLYYYDFNRSTILVYGEVLLSFQKELKHMEIDQLFAREIKFQNITFKLMTDETETQIKFFRNNSKENPTGLKFKKDSNPLEVVGDFLGLKFENPKEEKSTADECTICMDKIEKRTALIDCGHSTFCYKCVETLPSPICPICRKPFQKYIEIFL